ncbi:MAG: hypothetical protein ISS16_06655 [Ignavibacteria bacterium]|nr:hypothetical protein [Ignavibacteria bacterium]
MKNSGKVDRTALKKVKITEDKNDFQYWQKQSYEFRLETLEAIREEYNTWKYGAQQRLQRVCTIIKRR